MNWRTLISFIIKEENPNKHVVYYKDEALANCSSRTDAAQYIVTYGYLAEWRYQRIKTKQDLGWVPEMNVETLGELQPVTLWYRISKVIAAGQPLVLEDYNHFNEGHIKADVPPQLHPDVKFTGKWKYIWGWRTSDRCPILVKPLR